MKEQFFLDNASGSFPKAPGLKKALEKVLDFGVSNLNRASYDKSEDLEMQILETRSLFCRTFNFDKLENVVFTSGVTESLNCIIKGYLKENDRVLISPFEHNAVIRPLKQMEKERNITFDIIPSKKDNKYIIDLEKLEELTEEDVKLVIINYVSNVTGVIQPIEKISKILEKKNIDLVIDSAQASGYINIDLSKIKFSAFCFAGHKGLLALQGIGGIIFSNDFETKVEPLITGGTGSYSSSYIHPLYMPDKFEAGTQNILGILSLKHSLEYLEKIKIENINKKEKALVKLFLDKIKDFPIDVIAKDEIENRVSIVSIDFSNIIDNAKASEILSEKYNIINRCGLHCSPLTHKTIGTYPNGTVRFSLGYFNSEKDVLYSVNAIKELISSTK